MTGDMMGWRADVAGWLLQHERSARWLALRAGRSPQHVWRCLAGEREPSWDLLEAIAGVTQMRRYLRRWKQEQQTRQEA